jgi:hypothetical protein
MEARVNHAEGTVTIVDANTTIACCRYDDPGEVEYLFVGEWFLRRGHARRRPELVEAHLGKRLRFASPLWDVMSSRLMVGIVASSRRDPSSGRLSRPDRGAQPGTHSLRGLRFGPGSGLRLSVVPAPGAA